VVTAHEEHLAAGVNYTAITGTITGTQPDTRPSAPQQNPEALPEQIPGQLDLTELLNNEPGAQPVTEEA
jgi:hypothetical protein